MRYILTAIGVLIVLGVIANVIGGTMWSLADKMQIWWNCEENN